jgi:O-antigen ligase
VSSALRGGWPRRRLLACAKPESGVALLAAAVVLWLAFHDGGYFPVTWNVTALALLWVVVVALLWRRDVTWGRLDSAFLIGLACLLLWTSLSAVWSIAAANSIFEAQRMLLYLAGGTAVLVVTSRRGARPAAIGVLAAATVVSGYALADRLIGISALPYNRLGGPVGYWNALGILAAAGVCLALAFASHERRAWSRALAAASLPILFATLYLTFSRGSWLALAAGLIVSAWLDPRRRELASAAVALAVPCALVLAAGAGAHALTTPTAPLDAVTADAHRLAFVVLCMCATAAPLGMLAPRLGGRLPRLPARRVAGAACAVILIVALIAAGGPARWPGALAGAANAAPPSSESNLTTHLFSLTDSWRGELWHVALVSFASHPLFGNGAGTFDRLWVMKRQDATATILDAHSVYLETLAELGIVGLALLLAVLAVPLVAARRALSSPYIAALTAAYVAFLAHAAIDWDWEMPVVTLSALVCGAAIVAAARRDSPPLRRNMRTVGLVAALGLACCTLVLLIGNQDLNAAAAAAGGQSTLQARALEAQRWAPWSPNPPRWLAMVALADGNHTAARRLFATAIAHDGSDWSLWLELAAASTGPARTAAFLTAVRLDPHGAELPQVAYRLGLLPTSGPQSNASVRQLSH